MGSQNKNFQIFRTRFYLTIWKSGTNWSLPSFEPFRYSRTFMKKFKKLKNGAKKFSQSIGGVFQLRLIKIVLSDKSVSRVNGIFLTRSYSHLRILGPIKILSFASREMTRLLFANRVSNFSKMIRWPKWHENCHGLIWSAFRIVY